MSPDQIGIGGAISPGGSLHGPWRQQASASGGIGRRARFRSVYSKGCGGSTPPSRTRQGPGDPGAFVISPCNTKQPALLDEGYGLLTFRWSHR